MIDGIVSDSLTLNTADIDGTEKLYGWDASNDDYKYTVQQLTDYALDEFAKVNIVNIVTRPQCSLSGKVDSSGNADYLSIVSNVGTDDQIQFDAASTEYIGTLANGFSTTFSEVNYMVNITADIQPTNWLFTGTDAADRYLLYIEVDATDPQSIVLSYDKTAGSITYNSVAPSSPTADDLWYNTNTRLMYIYTTSWEEKIIKLEGSVDWNGSTTLTDLFIYDFKALTKVDNTKYLGGHEYSLNTFIDLSGSTTTGQKTITTLPINTKIIETNNIIFKSSGAGFGSRYAKNLTEYTAGNYVENKSQGMVSSNNQATAWLQIPTDENTFYQFNNSFSGYVRFIATSFKVAE